MRRIGAFLLLLSLASWCGANPMKFSSKRIENALALELATEAEKLDLLKLPDAAPTNIYLWLYSISNEGDCVPETHLVCSFTYFLASRHDGYSGISALFELGQYGEIADIKWVESKDLDVAVLEFSVYNYPKYILERSPALIAKVQRYRLRVEVDKASGDRGRGPNRHKIAVVKI